jgi:hypothetical protein
LRFSVSALPLAKKYYVTMIASYQGAGEWMSGLFFGAMAKERNLPIEAFFGPGLTRRECCFVWQRMPRL